MEFELLKQVSQFGILGIILALVWWMAIQLWRDLKVSWEARIVDNKHLASVIETTNNTYSALAAATENRVKAHEAISLAQLATSKALESQIRALEKVVEGNENLIRGMDKLVLHSERLREEIKLIQRMTEEINRSEAKAR